MNRRTFLKSATAAATALVGSRCASRSNGRPFADTIPGTLSPAGCRLAPVRVSPDREIRTIAGLRPYRPSGFVVRGEKLGEKTVIHNYGHGGGGITLSWGTAQLAVEEGAKVDARSAAVVGCGVVGLSTARLL